MILRNFICFGLIVAFVIQKLAADVSVKINVYPKYVKSGEDLTVKCLIYNTTSNDRLKTYLYCPFIEKKEYCYADCIDLCQHMTCNEKDKSVETFKCSRKDSNNPMVFTYKIPRISEEQINNQKFLPFSCKYKGLEVRDNVTVISNTKPEEGYSIIITELPITSKRKSSTIDSLLPKDFFDLELRNIILIVLISSLGISFFLNVWCCVQCCLRNVKMRKRKKKEKLEMNALSSQNTQMSNERLLFEMGNHQSNEENAYPSVYCSNEYIRRAKSQPALAHDGKTTPVKVSTSNLNKIRPGSMNNNLKHRTSIYNSSVNDFYHNGSIPEYINPLCGPQILNYAYPQFIQVPNGMFSYHPNDRMNASQSEDLNTLEEQATPERRQSSIIQPLPSKPDDCFSNLDSASSSHIV